MSHTFIVASISFNFTLGLRRALQSGLIDYLPYLTKLRHLYRYKKLYPLQKLRLNAQRLTAPVQMRKCVKANYPRTRHSLFHHSWFHHVNVKFFSTSFLSQVLFSQVLEDKIPSRNVVEFVFLKLFELFSGFSEVYKKLL